MVLKHACNPNFEFEIELGRKNPGIAPVAGASGCEDYLVILAFVEYLVAREIGVGSFRAPEHVPGKGQRHGSRATHTHDGVHTRY